MTATTFTPPVDTHPTGDRLRIAMVSCALPPQLDGIGDYSSRLSSEFSKWADVSLHTSRGFSPEPIANVPVIQSFDIAPRHEISGLRTAFDQNPPDVLIVQYNPFCFGQKGFNPYLAGVLRQLKKKYRQLKLLVMVHERFMPANSPRNIIMWAYQYQQFTAVTALADMTLFSTGPWHEAYRRRHPNRTSCHMPVFSNLPFVYADRDEVRRQLNIPEDAIVLGSFGGNHPSRLFGLLAAAGSKLKSSGHDVRLLSIGSAGPAIKAAIPDLSLIDLGKLPGEDVSKNLRAIDIYCSPFFDGVSTRRGSFWAGLQHGLATVTTRGYNTDGDLLAHADKAFIATSPGNEEEFVRAVALLAGSSQLRNEMARQAKVTYDQNYALPVLAQKWHDCIGNLLPNRC
jgi:glycosyltransferase involved in cell wall biosynthesis